MTSHRSGAAFLTANFGPVWAARPGAFSAYALALGQRSRRTRAGRGASGTSPARPARKGTIVVVPITGLLLPGALPAWADGLIGYTAMDWVISTLKEFDENSAVSRILLKVDSPGGAVAMIPEAAEAIRQVAKPIDAAVSGSAGSAAYWLASQADRLTVTPSGDVGSVGVFAIHVDETGADEQAGIKVTYVVATDSPRKVDEASHLPLSPEAREDMLGRVDVLMAGFIRDVARGRKTTEARVRLTFGEGRVVLASEAKRVGMVDAIASFDRVLGQAMSARGSQSRASSAASRRNSILADSLIEEMS